MNHFTIEQQIPVHLLAETTSGADRTEWEFSNARGHGAFKKQVFKNIHICYGEMALIKNHYVSVVFPFPVVELFFSVLGTTSIYSRGYEGRNFEGNSHNILYCPDNEYYCGTPESRETAYTFHIILPEAYFINLVNTVFPVLDEFKQHINHKKFSWLYQENLAITPEMNSILQEIIDCRRTGMLKSLFTEAKVIKLLMLQLEQLEQFKGKKSVSFKTHDIEKIHKVKEFIDNNLSAPLTLLELARKAGLNDFKLKKGFKEIYGTTVFGYLTDVRMHEARRLLLENNWSVAEIATMCGYKYVQNFSTAFRQKYGVSPDKFRKWDSFQAN